jgi:acyl carrier protein
MSSEQLIEALAEEFPQVDIAEVKDDTILLDLLGWSSLNILIVRAMVQTHFGAKLTDTEIKEALTIKGLTALINQRLA